MTASLFADQQGPPPVLRECQVDVLGRVRQRFREDHRVVILQAPCAFGKTYCSSEMMRLAVEKGKRCLFLANRRRLVTQKSRTLKRFGVPHALLMAGEDKNPYVPVQVASRDTLLSRSVRSKRMELPPADFVIVDEAHRVSDKNEYAELLSAYPKAHVLLQTATPVWPDGTGMGKVATALECAVPTSQLVKDGYLVPFRCYAPDQRKRKGKGPKQGLSGDPVAAWRMYGENRPTVLFAAKVAESKAIVERFLAAGIAAEHIDAKTSDDDREKVFARVESGQTKILANASVMVEGADLPILSCVQFVRSAGSYVFWIQGCGRGSRPHPESGKRDCVVICHSDAVFQHGFPDEDVEWSLNEGESVEERNKKAKKEGKRREPICCPKCCHIFSGAPACPVCGHALPASRKKSEAMTQAEILCEVERQRQQSPEARLEAARAYWRQSLFMAAAQGRSCGTAASMFKNKFGSWPDAFPGLPADMLARGVQWRQPVADVFPWTVRRKKAESGNVATLFGEDGR